VPFKSEAQRKYLYANNPKLAKEFESKTTPGTKLPQKVKPSKPKSKDPLYQQKGR
jgi:hypothetical protein